MRVTQDSQPFAPVLGSPPAQSEPCMQAPLQHRLEPRPHRAPHRKLCLELCHLHRLKITNYEHAAGNSELRAPQMSKERLSTDPQNKP